MKNLKYFSLLLIAFLSILSCSKEIEYGSDFEFKINNIDNNSIVVHTDKSFSLEILNLFNSTNSKSFSLSYSCQNVDIINNNITLLQNTPYPFEMNEQNLIPLKLVASNKGIFQLTIVLTDAFGVTKEKKILVKVVEDLNFTFIANNPQPLYEKEITTTFNFSMQLTNIGSSADTYRIKAYSSLQGNININGNLVVQNELNSSTVGNINASFTPSELGVQTLTFIVVNSANIEKEVSYNLKVNPKVFTVAPPATLQTKQTLSKTFTFAIGNTIPNWQYQVKFQSNTLAKFYTTAGLLIPTNVYINLPLNMNTFTYKYLSDTSSDDILTITVKDQFGQVVSNNTSVSVFSRPLIGSVIAPIIKNGDRLNALYKIMGTEVFGGASITDYEFKVLNYSTENYDTYTSQSIDPLYPINSQNILYFSDYIGWAHSPITNEDRNINYYWNQPFSARVKDSDGVWSQTFTGTMTY